MAGMHVTLPSRSAPQGLILTDTGPGLLENQGKRGSQRKGEKATGASLMQDVTSCPPLSVLSIPGPAPSTPSPLTLRQLP